MFNNKIKNELKQVEVKLKESNAVISSIKNNIATIEFSPDGTIIDANELFLAIAGYQKQEVIGKHHSVMCLSHYSNSSEYKEFWQNLREFSFNLTY